MKWDGVLITSCVGKGFLPLVICLLARTVREYAHPTSDSLLRASSFSNSDRLSVAEWFCCPLKGCWRRETHFFLHKSDSVTV
ncbi:hypothetical protein N9B57_05250, partial [Verrucomicrobia bacterium]|nr:hypothetical protein [Verrucomicrobiota bacterium]